MLVDQPRSGALERDLAPPASPERDTERVKVGTYVRSYPGKLLGAGVSRCPGKSSRNRNLGNRTIVSNRTFGQAQIDDFALAMLSPCMLTMMLLGLMSRWTRLLLVDCFQASGDQRRHLQGG